VAGFIKVAVAFILAAAESVSVNAAATVFIRAAAADVFPSFPLLNLFGQFKKNPN